MTEEYTLTVAEAAAMLGGTEKAIQRLIYTARLDAIRIKGARGHEFRVRATDVTTRKAELQQRIADTQSEGEPRTTNGSQSDTAAPSEPTGVPEDRLCHDAPPPPPAPASRAVRLLAAAEAIPVGVYQELFRRYDLLGRRAAKLECENRFLRDALHRLQTPGTGPSGADPPASAPPCAGDGVTPPPDQIPCQGSGSMPAEPPAAASRQLWRAFAGRFMLLGGIRPPRP
jgi:hypothetical protein